MNCVFEMTVYEMVSLFPIRHKCHQCLISLSSIVLRTLTCFVHPSLCTPHRLVHRNALYTESFCTPSRLVYRIVLYTEPSYTPTLIVHQNRGTRWCTRCARLASYTGELLFIIRKIKCHYSPLIDFL